MPKVYDRIEIHGGSPDDWLWCLHCERCYQLKDCREVGEMFEMQQLCHYPDCNGDTVLDAQKYSGNEPPELNKKYQMSE